MKHRYKKLQRKEASNKTFDVQAIYAEAGYDPTTPVEETHQNISTENTGNPRINKTNKFSNNKFQDKKPLFVQAQEKYDEKKAAREQKQNEFEERMQERAEKQKVYKELKAKRQKVLTKKNKRGQPQMSGRIELLTKKNKRGQPQMSGR